MKQEQGFSHRSLERHRLFQLLVFSILWIAVTAPSMAGSFFGSCPEGQTALFDVSPKVHDDWTKLCVTDNGYAKQETCDGRANQKIAIVNLGSPYQGHNLLISMNSKKPLHGTKEGEWHVRRAGIADTFSDYEGNIAQHYALEVVDQHTDPKNRSYMIANLKPKSGYKEIWDAGGNYDWAHVRHYSGHVDPRRKFYFRNVTTACVPNANFGPIRDENDIPGIEEVQSSTHVPAKKTPPTAIGIAPFPAFFTQATGYSDTDVYYLVREGYWKRVFYYAHGGASETTYTQETKVGITDKTSTEISTNVGINVTPSREFTFKGITLSLSAEISTSLQVTRSESTETMTSKSCTISRKYQPNDPVVEVLWYRADRFSIMLRHNERPDTHPDSVVFSWEIVDPSIAVTDAWRPSGSSSTVGVEEFSNNCSL